MSITSRLCVSLALAATALSSPSRSAETNADWIRKPTPEQILAVYPRAAMQQALSGSATIGCIVTAQGGLRSCQVESEKPQGAGFGAAALALTAQFLMKPATHDGVAVEGRIHIPIRFEWDGRTATSFIPGASTSRVSGMARVYSGLLAWSAAPAVSDLVAAYPPKARAERTSGRVSLDCRFTKAGKLSDCETLVEEPSGFGFAHAARALADKFQGPTVDAEGHSMAGGHTQLVFAFPAEALDPAGPHIGKPQWAALPSAADLASVRPAQAKAAGVLQARVVLQCTVGGDGSLTACAVQTETPGDLGYGQAALTLAGRFRVGLWTEEGLPTVGGQMRLPIRFDYAAPPPANP